MLHSNFLSASLFLMRKQCTLIFPEPSELVTCSIISSLVPSLGTRLHHRLLWITFTSTINWTGPAIHPESNESGHISIVTDHIMYESVLTFLSLSKDDEGTYQCICNECISPPFILTVKECKLITNFMITPFQA